MSITIELEALWDETDPTEVEERLRKLLPGARENGNVAYEAGVLALLARSRARLCRFDEAHELLDQADRLAADNMPHVRVLLLLERGRTYHSAGRRDQAQPRLLSAYEMALAVGETLLAVDAAQMMAIVDAAEAARWTARVVELTDGGS